MAEELRAIFDHGFIDDLSKKVKDAYPSFQNEKFTEMVYAGDWNELSLKQRVRRISECFHATLGVEYKAVIDILKEVAPNYQGNLSGIIFPDYVEVYGLHDWETSIEALEYFTQFSSSEFAVRPFVVLSESKMMEQFLIWSKHPNEHVRRLASEGSRPRLPWGMALKSLKKDPSLILPILENLKEDPSLYVRKSVANNLNDISKDHPDITLALAKRWYGNKEITDWIVKKALRTLLKKGNVEALELFGLGRLEHIKASNLEVTESVSIGDSCFFTFTLESTDGAPRKLRVEYVIDFVKANGKHSPKQFQISESTILPGETRHYTKVHSFKDLSTRKHYQGVHFVSIVVNGEVKIKRAFNVINEQKEDLS